MIYDTERAEAILRDLPNEAKLHLSHVVRNGICNVLAVYKLGQNVEEELQEFESEWEDLGL
jgi:hypothetical protein